MLVLFGERLSVLENCGGSDDSHVCLWNVQVLCDSAL